MEEIWWNLPLLRRLSPIGRAFFESAAVMCILALGFTGFLALRGIGRPQAGLLETLAQVGATFLVAYVLEVTWLVKAHKNRPLAERQTRLGRLLGFGAASLVSIGAAIALAGQADAQHWGWSDKFEFGVVLGGLLMVGVGVVMQPLFTHEWVDEFQMAQNARSSNGARPEQSVAVRVPRPPVRSRRR